MNSLSISVVIPTYNRANLLSRSITSALREMVDGDELIVVDDGSADDTASVVSRFGKPVRYVRIDNSGTGRARNVGVGCATRELVAFLDSDDEYMPGRLELARRLLSARPDVLFTFTDMAGTTKSGTVERFFLRTWHQDPRPWDQILGPGVDYSKIAPLPGGFQDFKVYAGSLYRALARAGYVAMQTVTVRRREAGPALHFDEDWRLYEDWGCAARLAKRGTAAYLEVETAWQHTHGGPRLTSAVALTHASTRVELLKRIWGEDPEYLSTSGGEYRELLDQQQSLQIRCLFVQGRRAEAVHEMRSCATSRLSYKILAVIPGPLTKWLAFLSRSFLGLARR